MKTTKKTITVRIFLPFIITAVLFLAAMFFIIIPVMHNNRVERKKLAIKDLTMTAWETLAFYNSLEEKQLLTSKQAKNYAKSHIRSLRYGKDMKNYFWIINMRGVTIVNPYHPNLEGFNQTPLTDINGKFFIKEFIKTARDNKGGFVEYMWQWKDDPNRIELKVSYVKRFHEWEWIIGTGTYMDDIEKATNSFSTFVLLITIAIMIIVSILSFHFVNNFIATEKKRTKKSNKAKKTESKIRLMIQSIPDMIIRFDKNGQILDVKEPHNFKPFIHPGKMLGSTIADSWPEEIAQKNINALETTFATSKPQTIVFNVKVGKKKSMQMEAHFVNCGRKEVLATFRDITHRNLQN